MVDRASAGDDVYFTVPGIATVRWDGPRNTVVVEWDGWANASEFKSLLDAEVKALREHHGTRLLADCRRQRVLDPAVQERVHQVWVPAALGVGLKRFAIVLPENETAAAHLRERLSSVTEMQVAYFSTVEEARDWLGR